MSGLLHRCRTGVGFGLVLASIYSAYVIVVFVASDGAVFERRGLSLGSTLLTYLAGGIVGGILYGVLAPLARWRFGAFMVGYIVAIPVCLGAAVALPDVDFGSRVTWFALAIAPLAGGIVGYQQWGWSPSGR